MNQKQSEFIWLLSKLLEEYGVQIVPECGPAGDDICLSVECYDFEFEIQSLDKTIIGLLKPN